MSKILTILTLSLSVLITSEMTLAAPHEQKYDSEYKKLSDGKNRQFDENNAHHMEKRRTREERGVKRLQQHQWQAGYVLPQHYRGNRYKVDYQQYNLQKPNRNEQWYKINNDYILVNPEGNNIIKILNR